MYVHVSIISKYLLVLRLALVLIRTTEQDRRRHQEAAKRQADHSSGHAGRDGREHTAEEDTGGGRRRGG